MSDVKRVLVTGGAGYVGAVLVPKLLAKGYQVRVLDLYMYGQDVLDSVKDDPNLEQVKGDIRDEGLLKTTLPGCDAVIHLACISNDPSFELNPELGRSINYDAFSPLVNISKDAGVGRFIFASTSSVYGISESPDVSEDHPLNPITDYSKYKALCEPILLEQNSPDFNTMVIRPATLCGYSPRQRLDLIVNILTTHAVNNRRINVFGGAQMRPNLHIEDMTDLYAKLLDVSPEQISGKTYNVGQENHTVSGLADMVRDVVQEQAPANQPVEVVTTPTDDPRSYHISSHKIESEMGFVPKHSVGDAIANLVTAFQGGKLPQAMTAQRYYNIKTMQSINLK